MNADLLVYQAKAFYNAYIALDQLSRDDSDTLLVLFAPLVVNGAFSVELALKAILAKNQIEYGKEHNLLILFQMLPKSFQQELWAYLIEKAPEYAGFEKGLDELILLSNAFVDWRYAFEGKPVPAIESRFLAAFAKMQRFIQCFLTIMRIYFLRLKRNQTMRLSRGFMKTVKNVRKSI